MEPNAGPNRTQTVPRNSQHGIWTSHHKAICNLWGVNWSLTWNPSGFSGVVLANSMLVTFGRPYFSFHIALTIKKLFGFQVCGGERTETKAPPRKGRDLFFDMCWVPCSSRNLPKWAATGRKLDSEERKSKRHEKTTKISKLRKSLERATRNKRQTWQFDGELAGAAMVPQKLISLGSMLVSVVSSTTTPGGHSRLVEESLTRESIRGDKMWPQPKNVQVAHFLLYQM